MGGAYDFIAPPGFAEILLTFWNLVALELVTLAFFASVRLTADTSENFLITLDEIAALIGAIIAVFTTPI
ncbi:hypothetical protein, partial [Anaerotignum faecicola]